MINQGGLVEIYGRVGAVGYAAVLDEHRAAGRGRHGARMKRNLDLTRERKKRRSGRGTESVCRSCGETEASRSDQYLNRSRADGAAPFRE